MEKQKVFTAVMSDMNSRKYVTASAMLAQKSFVKLLTDTIDAEIANGTITDGTDISDDKNVILTEMKSQIIDMCNPAPVTPDPGT